MSDRDTFGPRLRSERERRGISLDTIASVTKVSADLWDGLERNDFSRWPSGIFARAFVRDYARAVGLDSDEIVDEFCRLFPLGDRRASRLIKAHSDLIGHSFDGSEAGAIPQDGDRRSAARDRENRARAARLRIAPRALAAGIDTGCTLLLTSGVSYVLGTGFWATLGATAVVYYAVSSVGLGSTPGFRAADALRQRMPTLFTVHKHQVAGSR
jgi:transcriptional regulator with XRE-family HTH domain